MAQVIVTVDGGMLMGALVPASGVFEIAAIDHGFEEHKSDPPACPSSAPSVASVLDQGVMSQDSFRALWRQIGESAGLSHKRVAPGDHSAGGAVTRAVLTFSMGGVRGAVTPECQLEVGVIDQEASVAALDHRRFTQILRAEQMARGDFERLWAQITNPCGAVTPELAGSIVVAPLC